MIGKIERGESSPTASVLGRLSFGLTLTTLLSRAEEKGRRLSRKEDQAIWRDPESGYLRRSLISAPDLPLDLTEILLLEGASATTAFEGVAAISSRFSNFGNRPKHAYDAPVAHALTAS